MKHTSSLRYHINRFAHVTINVSDVERAREFYEATFPVHAVCRTGGVPQAIPSLGVDDALFTGWLLRDSSSYPARGIHLVQWLRPKWESVPYYEFFNTGMFRISAQTDDVPAWYDKVVAAEGRPFGEPKSGFSTPGSRHAFGFRDHDGTALEWISSYPGRGGTPNSLYHVNVNCTDIKESYDFYTQVVGLDPCRRLQPTVPQPWAESPPLGPPCEENLFYDAVFFGHRADIRTPLDLVQWLSPQPVGVSYRSPFNLGIMRLAWEVDDIELAAKALVDTAGFPQSALIGNVESWDFGDWGKKRVVTFQDPDGVLLELIERDPFEWEYDSLASQYEPVLDEDLLR